MIIVVNMCALYNFMMYICQCVYIVYISLHYAEWPKKTRSLATVS